MLTAFANNRLYQNCAAREATASASCYFESGAEAVSVCMLWDVLSYVYKGSFPQHVGTVKLAVRVGTC